MTERKEKKTVLMMVAEEEIVKIFFYETAAGVKITTNENFAHPKIKLIDLEMERREDPK